MDNKIFLGNLIDDKNYIKEFESILNGSQSRILNIFIEKADDVEFKRSEDLSLIDVYIRGNFERTISKEQWLKFSDYSQKEKYYITNNIIEDNKKRDSYIEITRYSIEIVA